MDHLDAVIDAELLYNVLKERGNAIGVIGGKRLLITYLEDTGGLAISFEGEGCFFLDNLSEEINQYHLISSGFDFLTAPAVAQIAEQLRKRALEERFGGAVRLIGEVKND